MGLGTCTPILQVAVVLYGTLQQVFPIHYFCNLYNTLLNICLNETNTDVRMYTLIITGRNEVVAKVMFLHVCVILFTGGVSRQAPPGTRQTPPDQAGKPLGPGPWTRQQSPQNQADPPPPRQEEDCSIRSMSGRYASYWNAFLFISYVQKPVVCSSTCCTSGWWSWNEMFTWNLHWLVYKCNNGREEITLRCHSVQ